MKITEIPQHKKTRLLESIFVPEMQLGNSAMEWLHHFNRILATPLVGWTRIELDEPLPESYALSWENKHGRWEHNGNTTASHNELGMAFAWWSVYEQHNLDTISLTDAPDIRGTIGNHCFSGDIGRCSPMALHEGLLSLCAHDLWITVIDWSTQLVLEPKYNIGVLLSNSVNRGIRGKNLSEDTIKNAFFCKECKEWAISPQAHKDLMMGIRAI